MADTVALKAAGASREGSSPSAPTIAIILPSLLKSEFAKCAREAIKATTPERHRVFSIDIDVSPSIGSEAHAQKLNYGFLLVLDCSLSFTHVFVMHDDAAPLFCGWATSLIRLIDLNNADGITFGESRSVGGMYRVSILTPKCFNPLPNPGDGIKGVIYRIHGTGQGINIPNIHAPWWTKNGNAFIDSAGKLLYVHLGGGTIGASNLRIPGWLWRYFVRRELRRL